METEELICSLWDYSDAGGSEVRFRGAIALQDGDDGTRAELQTQVARCLGLQGRYGEAQQLLDEVEAQPIARAGPPLARVHLERGRVFNSSGDRDAAITCFIAGRDAAKSCGAVALEIDALHMLGIAAEPARALEFNLAALALCDATPSGPARRWRGSLCNNIGWTLFDCGDASGALTYFLQAVDARREMNDEPGGRIAEWCAARALRELGRVEEALAAQRSLLARNEASGQDGPFVWEELGECLLALNRTPEARPWLAKACTALGSEPWRSQVTEERLDRLRALTE